MHGDEFEQHDEQPQKDNGQDEHSGNYMILGMAIGMCLGVAAGHFVFDEMATGLSVGMCLGLAIGISIPKKK